MPAAVNRAKCRICQNGGLARAAAPRRMEGIKFDKFRKRNCLHNTVDKTVETVYNSDFTSVSGG